MAKTNVATGWVGWIYFAGAMLLAVGAMQVIAGLVALFHDTFYVVHSSGLVAFNYTTWGWVDMLVGLLLILAGVGIWSGSTWAVIVGVFVAILSMVNHVAFISAYPLWSIIGVVIDGLIIYALTMHGNEVRE